VLGKGKLEEVVLTCLKVGAGLLIFDTELKPSQWRVITNTTDLKVLDRSMVILDIFAQRATSSEGRLQVELAQLTYNLPRLVEQDAGLSRLTGGIGGRGPGETKLEIGRRRARERITLLKERLEEITSQRALRRQRRTVSEVPLVAIIGYTNAGKSTLFNRLTGDAVLAENKLFATLTPFQRRVLVSSEDGTASAMVIISDTVGFIRELPEELMPSFRATLEEIEGASVVLHVVDASDPEVSVRYRAVRDILRSCELAEVQELVLLNKIDLCEGGALSETFGGGPSISISALTGEGLGEVREWLARRLMRGEDMEEQGEVTSERC
jgi:GTP-binding protein HflX